MQILIILNINYENKTIQTEAIDWIDEINNEEFREFRTICCSLSLIGFVSENTFIKSDSSIDNLYELESIDLAYYHCVAKKILKFKKKFYNPKIFIDTNLNYETNLLNIEPYAFLIKDDEKIIEEIKFSNS